MNRAGLLVVVVALTVAVTTAWSPVQAQEQAQGNGNIVIAQVVDASVKSAPLLSARARDQEQLKAIVDGRDIQVIEVNDLVNEAEAEMLRDLLSGSEVLNQNVTLVRAVAKSGGALTDALERHDVDADAVIAVGLTDTTDRSLTVYVFED